MDPRRNPASFVSTLTAQGPAAAVAWLNAGVPHRYTAVYRVDGGMLRNVLLHDKRGEMRPAFLAEVPSKAASASSCFGTASS